MKLKKGAWPMHDPAWVVIDTNVALDIWIFKDPRTEYLKSVLMGGELTWIATEEMREELKRVLGYAHINLRLQSLGLVIEEILNRFDFLVVLKEVAPKAIYRCKDEDDQKFIDLAVKYQTPLISKDKCVLTMKNRLKRLNVSVMPEWKYPAEKAGLS